MKRWHCPIYIGTLESCLRTSDQASTECPNKHGNSVTNSISTLLWISIVITDFKSHNIIMSDKVYLMKTVNGYKDVSLMSPQNKQWRRTSLLCLYTVIFLFYNINKQIVNIADENSTDYSFLSKGISTILNQRII